MKCPVGAPCPEDTEAAPPPVPYSSPSGCDPPQAAAPGGTVAAACDWSGEDSGLEVDGDGGQEAQQSASLYPLSGPDPRPEPTEDGAGQARPRGLRLREGGGSLPLVGGAESSSRPGARLWGDFITPPAGRAPRLLEGTAPAASQARAPCRVGVTTILGAPPREPQSLLLGGTASWTAGTQPLPALRPPAGEGHPTCAHRHWPLSRTEACLSGTRTGAALTVPSRVSIRRAFIQEGRGQRRQPRAGRRGGLGG